MDITSKRLARNIGVTLIVAKWVFLILLALMVPAMILSFLMPDGLSISGMVGRVGMPAQVRGSYFVGPVLGYASANLALALMIVTRLHSIMCTVATGRPFDPANSGRLRRIAAAIAGLAVLATVIRPLIPGLGRPIANMATPDLNLGLWLAAAVVFVLAEVFREGASLREDADMTV